MNPVTLDELIEQLQKIRERVPGTIEVSCLNTDGEWDYCSMADWEMHPVHGYEVKLYSTNQFATG